MASSSTSTMEHYVFLSFRGEDTRVAFTSHLLAALEKKAIPTYIDDYLNRGDTISDSLVKAIENSVLSVIIFSERYASSKWCLEELVKILECRKKGQTVIPIFYHVDPSDVRKQSGCYGEAFAGLVKRYDLEMKEERCFRAALTEAAGISGHDSRNIGHESTFIDEIVTDIFNKLCKMFPIHPMNLVGIDERISKIESLLEMESQKVRSVGIWGMGGIGKTTIAGAIYNKIRTEFEASLFVSNIREKLKTCQVVDLQRSIVSELLDNKNSNTSSLSFENHFLRHGLRRKKVLIVFDDVDDPMHLQDLLPGQCDSFGPGSRILVTSRDQHVLKQLDATYEVEALTNIEASQLLRSKAFKTIYPTRDHKDVLDMMVCYAKGNPLALVVLGSALYDRSKEDWYSKLNGLEKDPEVRIVSTLKISYDGLSKEEKNVFLDIACSFRGMDRDRVTAILQKESSSVHYCISVLIDKSLMTQTFWNTLEMHDLLRDMAYSVNEEPENPRKRRWLVDPEDVYHVLKKKKGTETVKGICLDMTASSEMRLKSDDFEGMEGLEFFTMKGNTSKVKLPCDGFKCLPKKLRYFRWDGYPSRSLAQKFCAKNLVEFDFSESKVEELWSGRQELVNLRRINLNRSHRLTKLPDLSEAEKLQYVSLEFCSSLIEVPSYFQNFKDLEVLYLCCCHNLQSIPRKINSNKINCLSFHDCSNIKKSPEIPANIERLYLDRTAIEELQQSFGGEHSRLDLEGCSNITKFPTISGNIRSLNLDETAIEEVPSSIQFLTCLTALYLNNCKKLSRLSDSIFKLKSLKIISISGCPQLKSLPEIKEAMESLEQLVLRGTAITKLPSSIQFLTSLFNLLLTNCKKLSSLPDSICELKSLKALDLRGTAIRELPELPPSLKSLRANECESLEIISSSTLGGSASGLCFANCFKLDQKALMEDLQLKIQFGKIANSFGMVLPGSEIPQWFTYQSTGSSITIQFPSNTNLKAIAFCSIVHHPYKNPVDISGGALSWEGKITGHEYDNTTYIYSCKLGLENSESYQMYLGYHNYFNTRFLGHEVKFEFNKAKFEFDKAKISLERVSGGMDSKVKMCGVHLIYENLEGLSISDDER